MTPTTPINPIELSNAIYSVLSKSLEETKMPKITIGVFYYEFHECIFSETAEVDKEQRLLCLNLLTKMISSNALTSKSINTAGAEVGAIHCDNIIITIAGIEPMSCTTTIVQALDLLGKTSTEEISKIKKELN